MKKRIRVCLLVLIMSTQMIYVAAGDYTNELVLEYDGGIYKYRQRLVTLVIDGIPLETEGMPAVLIEDPKTGTFHTMVPVREVFESQGIGGTVGWEASTQSIGISYGDITVELKIGKDRAQVNGQEIPLSVPAKLIRDQRKKSAKTMIPLRFVSENLGFDVEWDSETYTASIQTVQESTEDDQENVDEDENKNGIPPSSVNDLEGESVDRIDGDQAQRGLPTALYDNPIIFKEEGSAEAETNIVREKNEMAYIQDVEFDMDTLVFTINIDGKITNINTHMWDGKYILEVENAEFDRKSMEIDYQRNPIVNEIRMGRHVDEAGTSFGKIVFDLKESGYQFTTSLNSERNKIIVKPINSSLGKMMLAQNDKGDYIEISGVNARSVQIFRLSQPSRIVFDIPNTVTPFGYQEGKAKGQYVTSIRTSQFDETTTRIVIDVDGQPDYDIIEVDSQTTRIQILEPEYSNISYDRTEDDVPTVIIDKDEVEVNGVQYTDRYQDKEYIITIPGDYRTHFGKGNIKVNDGVIDNINVTLNEQGNTEVMIKTTVIREFRVHEDKNGIVIKAYKPTELYGKVIVVDAGHGGNDPGALASNGKYEKDINLGVTLELKKLLDKHSDIKVYYTRTTDIRPSLAARCALANEVDADFFISIHSNTLDQKSYRGTETLYLPGKDTPGLNSFELAEIVQEVFAANTKFPDYKIKERENLYVLNGTNMPAVILEMGYLSNAEDLKLLSDTSYYDEIGKGIELAILETFQRYPTGR